MLRWSNSLRAAGIVLTADFRTAQVRVAGCSAIAASPCTSFRARVSFSGQTGNVMIGFSTADAFKPEANDMNGWYLYTFNGFVRGPQQSATQRYGPNPVRSGSTVECIHNPTERTISFSVNGQSWGPAFRGVAAGELYPAITNLNPGDTVELL